MVSKWLLPAMAKSNLSCPFAIGPVPTPTRPRPNYSRHYISIIIVNQSLLSTHWPNLIKLIMTHWFWSDLNHLSCLRNTSLSKSAHVAIILQILSKSGTQTIIGPELRSKSTRVGSFPPPIWRYIRTSSYGLPVIDIRTALDIDDAMKRIEPITMMEFQGLWVHSRANSKISPSPPPSFSLRPHFQRAHPFSSFITTTTSQVAQINSFIRTTVAQPSNPTHKPPPSPITTRPLPGPWANWSRPHPCP